MVLLIDGEKIEEPDKVLSSLKNFFLTYGPTFEQSADLLKKSAQLNISTKTPALYINQREFAVVSSQKDEVIKYIGTDMATTCHIVVIRCRTTGVTSLGHFDGASTHQGVHDMIETLTTEVCHLESMEENQLDLHIIGGFDDDRRLSETLSIDLLKEFYCWKEGEGLPQVKIHLKTFCASSLNSKTFFCGDPEQQGDDQRFIKSPVIFGVAIHLHTGDITSAVFDDDAKGPQNSLRSSRSLNGVKAMANIYKPRENLLVIEPFTYKPSDDLELWIHQPDHIIRRYMSTSPKVEPENFEQHIRRTLKFIIAHPDPLKSIFHGDEPLTYMPKYYEGRMTWIQQ